MLGLWYVAERICLSLAEYVPTWRQEFCLRLAAYILTGKILFPFILTSNIYLSEFSAPILVVFALKDARVY